MSLSQPLILSTGATGRLAGLVLPELASRGARVRALIRDPCSEAAVRARGAVEVAVGTFADPGAMKAALSGVDRLFYVPPAFMPEEAAIGCQVVDIAQRMGVRRIVLSSAIHPTLSSLVNHRAKAALEEHIIASGLEYVFLQPTLVYQNYRDALASAARTGVFAEPYGNDVRITRVDYRDVAVIAAMSLCEDRLTNGTFELCASGDYNRLEVAEMMGQVLSRSVIACEMSCAEWLTQSGLPVASPLAQGLIAMFSWYDRHGLRGNATILRALLGREPRSLMGYFRELREQAQNPESGVGHVERR